MAAAQFEAVINLALLDAEYSLADEPGLVRALGMTFFHIPVIWESRRRKIYSSFLNWCAKLRAAERRVFLHCAANMRVSVFLALYRMLQLGWTYTDAMAQVTDVWEPDAVWLAFIHQTLGFDRPY